MKRIAFVVVLLLNARAGSTDPEPAKEQAGPAAKGTAVVVAPADPDAPGNASPQKKWAVPELPPPDETELLLRTPRRPTGAAVAPAPTGAAAKKAGVPPAGAKAPKPGAAPGEGGSRTLLASMKAITLVEGEARVTVAAGERVLRPGDLLGADTVRSVAEGVIVFDRPAVAGQAGGPATVVVRFEANGQTRVRVVYEQDPTPVQAPRMK